MAEKALRGLSEVLLTPAFRLLYPDDCRVCGVALREISRIPVCPSCLKEPEPLVAEFFCASCRAPFVSRFPLDENGQCMLCRQGLTGFDAVYSYGSYEGTLRKLIHLFKFDGVHTLARPLGNLLARVLPRANRYDFVTPMPLHWRRNWQRGFNQSDLLAKEIARRWDISVRRVVRRRRHSTPQSGLTNAQRRANVRGVFALRCGFFGKRVAKPLLGARILLVDDVLTTGATAAACARVLKRAGAAHVALLTVARTDRRMNVLETDSDRNVGSLSLARAAAGARSGGLSV